MNVFRLALAMLEQGEGANLASVTTVFVDRAGEDPLQYIWLVVMRRKFRFAGREKVFNVIASNQQHILITAMG